MAQKLYKWTGDIIQPTEWAGDIAPAWYGTDDSGNSYAYLDEDYAKLCKSSKDDLSATTASNAKTWVKTNSRTAKTLSAECRSEIRTKYSIDDEFEANRTSSTESGKAVLDDIAKIVASYATKKNALVGD
tara:strand:+ start:3647 stop:4036 length:390 start_codon:yes stop_codon:yes gene_type:complete